MKETRLKIGKMAYERGDTTHPHYAEYEASLNAQSEEPATSRRGRPRRR